MRIAFLALLGLAGCAAQAGQPVHDVSEMPVPHQVRLPADEPGLSYGGLNEDIRVGGLLLRPVRVTEDSRCPANANCVWAGRLVLSVRVSGLAGEQVVSTMEPLRLPSGLVVELASVWPQRYANAEAREPYRFGLRVSR